MRSGTVLLCTACIFSSLMCACSNSLRPRPGQTVPPVTTAAYTETAAADISVMDSDGRPVLLSDYLGTPVLLKFWASWNTRSTDELPALQRAYNLYGEDIAFLIVNVTDGTRETQQSAQAFLNEQGYTFPVLFDHDGAAALTYGAGERPVTVFIDADGFIVTLSQGEIAEDALLFGLRLL